MAIIRTFLHFYTNVVRAYTENKTHHLTENPPHPAMVVSRYTPFFTAGSGRPCFKSNFQGPSDSSDSPEELLWDLFS